MAKQLSKKDLSLHYRMETMYKIFCQAEKDNDIAIMETSKAFILSHINEYDNIFNVKHIYEGINE